MTRARCPPSLNLFILMASLTASIGESVIMPPRLSAKEPGTHLADPTTLNGQFDSTPDYTLSINEGESVEVGLQSRAAITVSLNRPIPQDVDITVTIYAGPDLIIFDDKEAKGNKLVIRYKANTFGDRTVNFHTTKTPGHAEIVCKVTTHLDNIDLDDSQAYISINVGRNLALSLAISIVGWIYFFAWSVSFYFQVALNYKRKSVVGLNFDFQALNLLGFTCYAIYNLSLWYSREVRKAYYERYTYTRIPVEFNDLFFAIHAVVLTSITVIQCFLYERGSQKVSIAAGVTILLAISGGVGLTAIHYLKGLPLLDVVFYLSYVKLAITVVKYMPQAYMNYKRKATTGWSIYNVLADFTGGALSISQMFLLAINYDDWISIFGNFTKFGLGVVSISYDMLFLVQHYILYRQKGMSIEDSNDSVPSPVINESIRSANYSPYLYTGQQNGAQASDGSNSDDNKSVNALS